MGLHLKNITTALCEDNCSIVNSSVCMKICFYILVVLSYKMQIIGIIDVFQAAAELLKFQTGPLCV